MELWSRIDSHLTSQLCPHAAILETQPLGACSYDLRKAAWMPMACHQRECHRYVFSVDAVHRKYRNKQSDLGNGMLALACRMCAGREAWAHGKGPSALERHAYSQVQAVFGPRYWYVYEMPVDGLKSSVDLMLVKKSNVAVKVAVHVDGKQHAGSLDTDARTDAQLRARGVAVVVRLPAGKQHTWHHLLLHAYWASHCQ